MPVVRGSLTSPMAEREQCSMTEVVSFRLETAPDRLLALAPAWRELLADSDGHAVMRDPAWTAAWLSHYGDGMDLAVGVLEQAGRLIGLAPFIIRDHTYPGGLRFRRLELIGSRAGAPDAVCSEYLDIISRRGWEGAVASAFAARMADGGFGAWDECVIEALLESGDGHRLAAALEPIGVHIEIEPFDQAPFVRLATDWETYLNGISQRHRYAIKRAMRDFEQWAEPDGWRLHRAEDAATQATGMQLLRQLHGERWSVDGETGSFASQRFAAFLESYAATVLSEGRLDLHWVTVRNEPIVVQFNMRAGEGSYFYQCGRKPDLPAKVRAGIVMNILMLQDAMRRGCKEYDFLGGPSQYKALFATDMRSMLRLRMAKHSTRETAVRTLKNVRTLGQHLYSTLRNSG